MAVTDSLKRARTRYRSHAALGRDLHMTGESIGRALKGARGMSPESVVRLAVLNGEDHLALLDRAGHKTFADLLRRIYEDADRPRLTRKQREILELIESLEGDDQKHLLGLARRLPHKP